MSDGNAHHHGMKDLAGMSKFCSRAHQDIRSDRFGRLFPELAASWQPSEVLEDVGRQGGPMDGGAGSDRTDTVAVGQVIFGQFIDHDITLDTSSSFSRNNNAADTLNVRTPTLDLDCIYGSGPEAHPFLYQQADPFEGAKLLTGADMPGASQWQSNDLLRSPNGRAMIGDPRNDENRVISQMQLGFINFHNAVAQKLHDDSGGELKNGALFKEARGYVTWHYQWNVVNDFLKIMCGSAVVDDILSCGRQFYCPGEPYIPIEFAVAAYRFGHSMVPMKIQIQKNEPAHELFGPVLGEGFTALTAKDGIVDWHEVFFTPENRVVQRAEKMDAKMATDLLALPFIHNAENSLATRNLLRGNNFLLPAGEKVAEHIGRPAQEIEKVMDRIADISGDKIKSAAPLWLYILTEAEEIGRETEPGDFDKGEGLGPVGARIIAEVIIGLLELDDTSWMGANRNWRPDEDYNSVGKILASTNSDLL